MKPTSNGSSPRRMFRLKTALTSPKASPMSKNSVRHESRGDQDLREIGKLLPGANNRATLLKPMRIDSRRESARTRKLESSAFILPEETHSLNNTTFINMNSSMVIENTNFAPKIPDHSREDEFRPRIIHSRKRIDSPKPNNVQQQPVDPNSIYELLPKPFTPATALKHFMRELSSYEQSEILEYAKIYYLGLKAQKVKPDLKGINHGYDDDKGDYKIVIGDHINYRYEIVKILGRGSFGQVCQCYDHKDNIDVAIKIIRNKQRFQRQGQIEVKVLEFITKNDENDSANVIHMYEQFTFRKHLCISFELLSINLYDLLKSNDFKGLTITLIRRIAVQVLYCLKFLKESGIIHCDLKPENILLKNVNKSGVKVIDLGSSCFDNEKLYSYIQSRFYRSPEVILGIPYSTSIDMWSFGCILAELFTGYPLFPGENEADQLHCIMEIKGVPPSKVLESSPRNKNFFDENGKPKSLPEKCRRKYPGTRTLNEKLRCFDKNFVNFLESKVYIECLEWNPAMRITPEQALNHEWILEAVSPPEKVRNLSEGRESMSAIPRRRRRLDKSVLI